MAAYGLETWDDMLYRILPKDNDEFLTMSSDELFRCIEQDTHDYPLEDNNFLFDEDVWVNAGVNSKKIARKNEKTETFYNDCDNEELQSFANILNLPEAYSILVNPRTGLPAIHPVLKLPFFSEHIVPDQERIKPYHPTHDHDYMKKTEGKDSEDEDGVKIKEEIDEGEPVVDVWKIENFTDEQVSDLHAVPEQLTTYLPMYKNERRTSKRTADIKRREQARKISHAVHSHLNIKKPVNVRQNKNNKLKNSVETTPSQSDIEEWHCQAVRPTYSKITKKKTSKGRIDHSQSERHRREVLKINFTSLSDLIPMDFLRGEKASSQISKQKILNGAKGYIKEMNASKNTFRTLQQRNRLLRELFQKNLSKLSKCLKRQK